MSRPPNTKPATAYDYRRYIVLVQAIATGERRALQALMTAWAVPVQRMWCDSAGYPTWDGMCYMLSNYVIEHHSDEAAATEV
jgi:hypothetical protein